MTEILNFENSRWRTAAILQIVLSLYLSRKSSDFNEIWCADVHCVSKVGYLTKYQNFAIQNGRRPPYWKSSFGYISTNDHPIKAKFCRITQNHVLTQYQNTEFRKFKMADGRHLENSFIAISQPEIIRIQRNLVCVCRCCFQSRLLNKISKFCKFKMADGRHIENRLLAISQRIIIRLTWNFVR